MALLIKIILIALCALVIFARELFTSQILYWCTFAFMFALVPLWWLAEYWVSKSRASKVLNKEPELSYFVGMVAENVNDDLIRGRLCFTENKIVLVSKHKGKYEIKWTIEKSNITNALSGKVAGIRKGFILYSKNGNTSFVCNLADEVIKAILKS